MEHNNRKEKVQELTALLEENVSKIFSNEDYFKYLVTMSRFRKYSVNNAILIWSQMPEATLVAGYEAWKKMGRNVKKGETSIKILAPCPFKKVVEEDALDENGEVRIDKNGDIVKEKVERKFQSFRPVSVFDLSQTEGKDLPDPFKCSQLMQSVEGYERFLATCESISPVPVYYRDIEGSTNGYFSKTSNEIVVRKEMGQSQTIKTLLHEITHATLHSDKECKKDKETKEVEAESTAFVVCSYFGIDTSDYSFGYVAGWSSSRKVEELKASMELIQKTANDFIDKIEAGITDDTLEKAAV